MFDSMLGTHACSAKSVLEEDIVIGAGCYWRRFNHNFVRGLSASDRFVRHNTSSLMMMLDMKIGGMRILGIIEPPENAVPHQVFHGDARDPEISTPLLVQRSRPNGQ
jgi:hypothetical protein